MGTAEGRAAFRPYAPGPNLNIVHLDTARTSDILQEGDALKSPVSLPPDSPSRYSGHLGTGIRTHDGYDPQERLPCWYVATGYDECSADLIEDPADGESILVLRQGSCSQTTLDFVHGGTPARVAGKSGWFRARTRK